MTVVEDELLHLCATDEVVVCGCIIGEEGSIGADDGIGVLDDDVSSDGLACCGELEGVGISFDAFAESVCAVAEVVEVYVVERGPVPSRKTCWIIA